MQTSFISGAVWLEREVGMGVVRDQTCYKQGGADREGPHSDRDPTSMPVYINLQQLQVEGCLFGGGVWKTNGNVAGG